MNDREFLRRARRYARNHRLDFDSDPRRGKGSHGEIPTGTLASMLRDLHIDRGEL